MRFSGYPVNVDGTFEQHHERKALMSTLTSAQKRFFASTKAAIQQAETQAAVAKIGASLKQRWITARAKDPLSQDTTDLRTLVAYAKKRYYQLGGEAVAEQAVLITDADMQRAEQEAEAAYESTLDMQASLSAMADDVFS